jgi:peptidoglycan-associated lipoprotein
MFRSSAASALALALVAILPACASKPETKPAEGPKRSFAQQHPSIPKEPPTPTTASVRVSDEIVRACGISDPDTYFAFDSARLNGQDTRVLDQIAKCFLSGPLKGRKMKLVGRADPRGSEEYNMTLGQHRADSVMKYLETKSLAKSAMSSTSRGEMDAVGDDEPAWAHDRRVDILLD